MRQALQIVGVTCIALAAACSGDKSEAEMPRTTGAASPAQGMAAPSKTATTPVVATAMGHAPRLPVTGERCVALPAPSIAEAQSAQCGKGAVAEDAGSARPRGFGYPYDDADLPEHVAYLTLDEGPSEWTASFLDALAKQDVRATFFVRGQSWVREGMGLGGSYRDGSGALVSYASVLKRIVDEGHSLGNLTLNHRDLGELDSDTLAHELDENERIINAALARVGVAPRPLTLVRPPFGSPWLHGPNELSDRARHEQEVGAAIEARGVNVLWNVDSTDSQEWAQGESVSYGPVPLGMQQSDVTYDQKVTRIEKSVLDSPQVKAGQGVIVLLNDIHNATLDAFVPIIEGLRDKGYRFATIEELVHERFGRASWEATPGPALHDPCATDADRSCQRDPSGNEVCGRFFRAYDAAGGADQLGAPLANAQAGDGADEAGVWSQRFEHAVIELRAEVDPPCNVIVRSVPQ